MRSPCAVGGFVPSGDTRSMTQPDLPLMSEVAGAAVTARAGNVGGFVLESPAVSAMILRVTRAVRPFDKLLTRLLVADCAMMPYQLCTLVLLRSVELRYWPVPKNSQTLLSPGFLPAAMPDVIGCTLPLASLAVNSFVPVLVGVEVMVVVVCPPPPLPLPLPPLVVMVLS